MHMYISIFYVVTQSFVKNEYFLCPMQKDKNMHRKKAYFSTKICHFYIDHIKIWFLLEQLGRHVEYGHVHEKNLFQIF
jgi:hypothetical protein